MPLPIAMAVAGETLKFGAKQYLAPAIAKIGKNIGVNSIMGLFGGGSSSSEAAAEQYRYNLALQKQAQEWNEYAAKNRWLWETESKEAAGINKLYGLGNAPSLSSGMNSVGMADKVGEQNNKLARMLEAFNIAREYSSTNTENKKKQAETLTEYYNAQVQKLEAIKKAKENQYIDKREQTNLDNLKSNTIQNMANAEKIIADKIGIDRINKWHENYPLSSEMAIGSKQFNGLANSGLASANMALDTASHNFNEEYRRLKNEYNKMFDSAKYDRKYYYRKYLY